MRCTRRSTAATPATTAAFEGGREWLDALLAGLDANRTLLTRLIAEQLPDVSLTRPEGAYLAWLDCHALGLDDDASASGAGQPAVVSELAGPARFFLDHARVALSSGHVFGTGGAGHVRLNFAASQAVLTEAVTRMGRAVEELRHSDR